MESIVGLLILEDRKDTKLLNLDTKAKCIPNHVLKNQIGQRTWNHLKRLSFLYKTDSIKFEFHLEEIQPKIKNVADDSPPWSWPRKLYFSIYPRYQLEEWPISTGNQSKIIRIFEHFLPKQRVQTVHAIRNGGGGIRVEFPNGNVLQKAIPTGFHSTDCRPRARLITEGNTNLTRHQEKS